MQYLLAYNNYLDLRESFGEIGKEDILYERLFRRKKKVVAPSDDYRRSKGLPIAWKKKIEDQIKKKESAEKNISFIKKLVDSIKSPLFKKWAMRLFFTLLAISLNTNSPIKPKELEKAKKLDSHKNLKMDNPRKIAISSTYDFDKEATDTLGRLKYELPKNKSGFGSYEDLIDYKMHLESRGNWKVWNEFGFMGLFQMGNRELKGVGFGHVTFEKFKKDPSIFPPRDQRIAYDRLIRLNKYFLRNYMHFVGKEVGGIYITEGAIIGASTIGVGNVKTFLDTNGAVDPQDGYGIKTSFLLKKFQNYDVSSVKMMTYKEWQDYKHGKDRKK
jgi:hypothetical protein